MTNQSSTHFDVVVIGAGPAGSSCATMLARNGVSVLLIDKAYFPRDKICGDCINPRSWDYFRLMEVDKEVAASSQVIEQIIVSSRGGRVLKIRVENSRDGNLSSSSSPFVAMKRSKLDSILLQRAVAAGITFFQSTSLESIGCDPESDEEWSLSLKMAGQAGILEVFCKFVVGADGRNSRVAHLLEPKGKEINIQGDGESRRVGVQFMTARPETLGRSVTMFFFEGGYGGIVGVSEIEANVAVVTTRELAALALEDFDMFRSRTINTNKFVLQTAPYLAPLGKISSAFPITPRRSRTFHPRSFLIGDARYTAEPFTGQGTFFAIQDGVTTAGRIAASLGFPGKRPRIAWKSHAMANTLFSPILRGERSVETLLKIGGRFEGAARLVARSVIS